MEKLFVMTVVLFLMGCVVSPIFPIMSTVCWFMTAVTAFVGLGVYVHTDPTRGRL